MQNADKSKRALKSNVRGKERDNLSDSSRKVFITSIFSGFPSGHCQTHAFTVLDFFMDVWNYHASVNYYGFFCSVKIYKRYPLGVSFKEISEGYCSYLKCVLCFLQRIFIPKYHSMQNWRRSYFVNQMIVSYTPMAKMVIQTCIKTISGLLDAVGYRLS